MTTWVAEALVAVLVAATIVAAEAGTNSYFAEDTGYTAVTPIRIAIVDMVSSERHKSFGNLTNTTASIMYSKTAN